MWWCGEVNMVSFGFYLFQACLLLLFFSKDILIDFFIWQSSALRNALLILSTDSIAFLDTNKVYSFRRIIEFFFVFLNSCWCRQKKRVFQRKTWRGTVFFKPGTQDFQFLMPKKENTCSIAAEMNFSLILSLWLPKVCWLFLPRQIFFCIFLWERKIDFANNKCNFSSTRNTFWCQAHSAVSLPPAKD